MTPLRLEIAGFGSYAATEIIDFEEKFGDSGVFLITGATGSGKTTIFDAICYALYGNDGCGAKRDAKSYRSDYASPNDSTYVKYRFKHKGKVYEIERAPEYQRYKKGKKGSQELTKSLKYAIFTDIEKNEILTRESDIETKIGEIIGLTADQFAQTVMIAQGDFLRILRAGTKERKPLFQTIFRTGIYARLESEIKVEDSKLAHSHEAVCTDLFHAFKRAEMPEETEFSATELANPNRLSELIQQLSELNDADTKLIAVQRGQLKTLDEEMNALSAEISESESVAKLVKAREEAEKRLSELNSKLGYYSETENKIEMAEAAERTVPARKLVEMKRREAAELRDKLANSRAELAQLTEMSDQQRKAADEAEKMLPEAERLRSESERLKNSFRLLTEYGKYSAESERASCAARGALAMMDEITGCGDDFTAAENFAAKAAAAESVKPFAMAVSAKENEIAAYSERLGSARKKLSESGARLEAQREKAKSLPELELRRETLREESESCAQAKELLAQYKASALRFEAASTRYIGISERCTALKNECAELRSAFYLGQAGIIAQGLRDGEECPVCGSKSHPHAAKRPESCPTQEQVAEAESAAEKAAAELAEADSERAALGASLDSCAKRLADGGFSPDMTDEQFDERIGAAEAEINDISRRSTEITRLLGEISEQYAVLESRCGELSERIKACEQDASELSERYREKLAENGFSSTEEARLAQLGRETSVKLSKLMDGYRKDLVDAQTAGARLETLSDSMAELGASADDDIQALEAKIQRFADEIASITEGSRCAKERLGKTESRLSGVRSLTAEQEENLTAAFNDESIFTAQYESALKQNGFSDSETCEAAMIDRKKLTSMKTALMLFRNELAETRTQSETIAKQLEGRIPTDTENLTRLLNEKRTLREELSAKERSLSIRIEKNRSALAEIRNLSAKKHELHSRWTMVSDVARTISGGITGKEKLSFEAYIQQYYFKQVVAAANKRLYALTDGGFTLRCRELNAKKNTQSGLDLEVHDCGTGQWRDVSTLSGGESFMASLALALGLSDIVQAGSGGVRLDSMFIDEGFGTLDDGKLRQTMKMLATLADGKRLVGIISHVADLKSSIDKKIVVSKNGFGSTLTIET